MIYISTVSLTLKQATTVAHNFSVINFSFILIKKKYNKQSLITNGTNLNRKTKSIVLFDHNILILISVTSLFKFNWTYNRNLIRKFDAFLNIFLNLKWIHKLFIFFREYFTVSLFNMKLILAFIFNWNAI